LNSLGQGLIPRMSKWDLLWIQWHWDTFFSEYFGFTLSIIIPTNATYSSSCQAGDGQ